MNEIHIANGRVQKISEYYTSGSKAHILKIGYTENDLRAKYGEFRRSEVHGGHCSSKFGSTLSEIIYDFDGDTQLQYDELFSLQNPNEEDIRRRGFKSDEYEVIIE